MSCSWLLVVGWLVRCCLLFVVLVAAVCCSFIVGRCSFVGKCLLCVVCCPVAVVYYSLCVV